MRPAFSGRTPAAALCALLLACLALPVVLPHLPGFDAGRKYLTVPTANGNFEAYRHQIFDRKEDIDMLFLGSCLTLSGVDTPLISRALTEYLGRPAIALNFGALGHATELVFQLLKETLAHRTVKMIVIESPREGSRPEGPDGQAFRWWGWAANRKDLEGLGWSERMSYFALAVVGAPRHLFELFGLTVPDGRRERDETGWVIEESDAVAGYRPREFPPSAISSREIGRAHV